MDHFYSQIHGWSHYLEPWYQYIVSTLPDAPQVVEVGCWHGRSTAYLAVELINHRPGFELHTVDHWLGCNEGYYHINSVKQEIANDVPYQTFLKNMNPILSQIKIIRDTSSRAAEQFANNSLDLVILDDEHSQEGVVNSITAWWPKIKIGGIICGDDHDQHYPGVANAVRTLFGSKNNSYRVYTKLGWGMGIDDHGVWVTTKTVESPFEHLAATEDPWEYKLPLSKKFPAEPELPNEPQTESEQKEQTAPITNLQNPKIRSII